MSTTKQLVEDSKDVINDCISEVMVKISNQLPPLYSQNLAEFAKEIFESKGTAHGRNWQPNEESTAKKKKGLNRRNYDTGELERTLTEDGFLVNEDYMDELGEGYHFANMVGDGVNRFDDIGKREEDKAEILERSLQQLVKEYK